MCPNIKIDMEDVFDPDTKTFIFSFKEDVSPESKLNIPMSVEKKREKKALATNPIPRPVAIPKKPILVEKRKRSFRDHFSNRATQTQNSHSTSPPSEDPNTTPTAARAHP